MKTLQQVAQEALAVQSASNLSGVVRSFAEVMDVLWANGQGFSIATHPVSRLFAEQIAFLADTGNTDTYSAAYAACQQWATGAVTPERDSEDGR